MWHVRMIRCDCGFEASGEDDDDLVARAQDHSRDVHSTVLSAEQALARTGLISPDTSPSGPPSE